MGNWSVVSGTTVTDIDTAYGVRTTAWLGHGIPPVTHNYAEQALLPGALYQSTKVQPRDLVLKFSLQGTSLPDYHHLRDHLVDAFRPTSEPLQLRYTGAGGTVDCYGYYEGGLDGDLSIGNNIEQLAARFRCYDPFFYAPTAGTTTLTSQTVVAGVGYLTRRLGGSWTNVDSGAGGGPGATVYALAVGADARVYVGGALLNRGGDGNQDGVAVFNPATNGWAALGSGVQGTVAAMALGADGSLYVGGNFLNAGDVPAGDYIAKWNGSAWSGLGTGAASDGVYALAVGHDGALYAAGSFSGMGGVANTLRVAKWNGTAWVSLGTGFDGLCYAAATGKDGCIYFGGAFTTANGGTVNGVAKYDPVANAWSALGSGMGGATPHVRGMAAAPDGSIYATGFFTTSGGVTTNGIARWTGAAWQACGDGVQSLGRCCAVDSNGELWVGGFFTSAGGLSLAERVAIWNGTTWRHVNVDLPGTPIVQAIAFGPLPSGYYAAAGDTVYLGYDTTGDIARATINTVTNNGSAPVYPTITVTRSGGTVARVEYIQNVATGQALYLNYSLLDGETLTIDLAPGDKSITSSYYGDVIGRALLPSSDFSAWRLDPGANGVSLYVYQTGSPTVTARCIFKPTYWSVDGVAP